MADLLGPKLSDWRPFEFLQRDTKNAKKCLFLRLANFLEFLVVDTIFRVPPCESSRPEDFRNVVIFGRRTFLRGVIAAESQRSVKFWVR